MVNMAWMFLGSSSSRSCACFHKWIIVFLMLAAPSAFALTPVFSSADSKLADKSLSVSPSKAEPAVVKTSLSSVNSSALAVKGANGYVPREQILLNLFDDMVATAILERAEML